MLLMKPLKVDGIFGANARCEPVVVDVEPSRQWNTGEPHRRQSGLEPIVDLGPEQVFHLIPGGCRRDNLAR